MILIAAENIIRPVIAVPRIDAIDRVAIRQRCLGDDEAEHLAFAAPLELEDVAIAFRKRVFPEWQIGAERVFANPMDFKFLSSSPMNPSTCAMPFVCWTINTSDIFAGASKRYVMFALRGSGTPGATYMWSCITKSVIGDQVGWNGSGSTI
jgi:hypothetical protein